MIVWRLPAVGALVMAVLVFGAAGCGGDDDDTAEAPPPVAKPQDFPDPSGKTLLQLRKTLPSGGPVLAPSVSQLEPGRNRFGFGLFDRSRAQIADAAAAVYVAPVGGGPVKGPFPARYESLDVAAPYRSTSVSEDPDAASLVYVTDLKFDRPGAYEVMGVVRLDDRLVAATSAGGAVRVIKDSPAPEVGEPAPRISTPTVDSVGGDAAKVDTRQPPGTMHEVDFADVVGKQPVVLLFATPALCQTRVCGPVVDIAEEVKAEHPDDAAWIAMEVYNDNEIKQGCTFPLRRPLEYCFRPQFLAYNLPTEPWLFTIDASGKVAARIEGAYSADELEAALEAATKGS